LKPLINNHQTLQETTQKTTKEILKDHHMEPLKHMPTAWNQIEKKIQIKLLQATQTKASGFFNLIRDQPPIETIGPLETHYNCTTRK
jgi:hypothetical protein